MYTVRLRYKIYGIVSVLRNAMSYNPNADSQNDEAMDTKNYKVNNCYQLKCVITIAEHDCE